MKIGQAPGEYYFRGLIRPVGTDDSVQHVWFPSPGYFSSKEEMEEDFPANKFETRWPIEFDQSGVIYSPAAEEMSQ